ncbi:MerR family transcriptional regulator [Pseudomonas sp. N040]|uniref:MerR family transcriptional regulator n=1 Tax=Pseudomonas sp. N040 TaxID=2785325 RepID=UPI0018A32026|nr:MerR family transcriptional regulator [Pseudomonas sp. N040]MBF7730364.1 MerR family transcriptional regulator [Pseudomonas sp. N040]MBW7014006.1 MerR family transcriptional regulator [Pseudomonas sp. N040]
MTDIAGIPSFVAASFKQEDLFPIREVSRLTGVNPVTLRAWERRYGLIQPTRTDSGHRLYSQADIEAVRSILAWIERGVAVSKVGKILARADAARSVAAPRGEEAEGSEWDDWQEQFRVAVGNFDDAGLARLYGHVFSTYPLTVVFEQILLPLWRELLVRKDNFGQTSEWLFLDSFLRSRVLARLSLGQPALSRRVLLVAIPGHCHELELLVTGLLLASAELAVMVLAPGQPLLELPLVCEKVEPRALVLFSNHAPDEELQRSLARLAQGLECPVALAGEAADLAAEILAGSLVGCLGSDGVVMQRRLQQFLEGHLDT